MPTTKEEKFWSSDFGVEYLKRNKFSVQALDQLYNRNFGVSRSGLNREFLGKLKLKNILEVGCGTGNQLALLQSQGYKNTYGIEIFPTAVQLAKAHLPDSHIIWGSVFDIPFRNGYFDLVFTSGVLIHINPKNLKGAMQEIYRVTKKYIWGYEYYHPTYIGVTYRSNKTKMWKGDFPGLYLKYFPKLKLVKRRRLKYLTSDNYDEMFLLKKYN